MIAIAALLTAALTAQAAPPPSRASYKPRRARVSNTVRIGADLYGPRREFRGIWATAFELSGFGGCWFTSSDDFSRQFDALGLPDPPPRSDLVRYELVLLGRQTVARPGRIGGYGHLGMWNCQIRAETLISAKLLPTQPMPLPPPPAR